MLIIFCFLHAISLLSQRRFTFEMVIVLFIRCIVGSEEPDDGVFHQCAPVYCTCGIRKMWRLALVLSRDAMQRMFIV